MGTKQNSKGDALTPAQLKKLQEPLPSSSPYLKGKSPFKQAKGQILGPKEIYGA